MIWFVMTEAALEATAAVCWVGTKLVARCAIAAGTVVVTSAYEWVFPPATAQLALKAPDNGCPKCSHTKNSSRT